MSKKGNGNSAAKFFDVLFSLALIAGIGYGGYYLSAHNVEIDQTHNYTENIAEEPTEATEESNSNFETLEIRNSEIHSGNLILVNNDTEFQGSEENLVSLYHMILEKDCHSFGSRDGDLQVRYETGESLIAMFDAFYQETYNNNVVVQSGYRSKERQQELYDEDLEETGLDYSERVSVPGFSEHQTGLCVDLTLGDGEYDGTGDYNWINEHCAEYGLILRYPEGKTEVTKIAYEPWHYRYIGKPHAQYLMQSSLCLEEYIQLLYGYSYNGDHLQITDAVTQQNYEIYYYPADTAGEVTNLPVPANTEYSVSGNNIDGFIVTFQTDQTTPVETETAQEELS